MRGVDEQLRVRGHEWHPHRDVAAVGQHELRAVAERLDRGEDVIPASRVEAVGVFAQLVQDLVHLKRGRERLDQNRRADQPAGEAEPVLAPGEHLVPQSRLEMVLELRQVQVHTAPASVQSRRAVEREQAEVKQRTRDRLVPRARVTLLQVPAPRAHDQRRGLLGELVGPPPVVDVGDRAVDRVDQVRLAGDLVAPGG